MVAPPGGRRYRAPVAFPRRLLTDGEELILDLRPHWIALAGPVLLGVVLVAGLIVALVFTPDSWPSWVRWVEAAVAVVLFVWLAVPRIVAWSTSHFVVTTDRLIHRSGWISKRSMEIPLEKISDVRFHQGVFERMIGAGDLVLESAGEFGQETFSDVRHPEAVQKVVYEMGERNQRAMAAPAPVAVPTSASTADELDKLARLRAEGVLSDQEFEAQKARLLGRG
jgi:uncharacterized membrane protein YdbT with pleckstrin-like domain